MFVNILPKLSFWLYIYILNFFPLINLILLIFLQANILHVKHGWDDSLLYSHKHARGDTVQGYGTPGIGAKFIGKEKDNVSEAGRAAWNLFAKFADSKFFCNTACNIRRRFNSISW